MDGTAALRPRPITRRNVLRGSLGLAAAGALVVAVSACGGSPSAAGPGAGALRPLDVQLVWLKNVQFGGSFLAQQHGYYDRLWVAPNLITGGPQVSVEPVVVQGRAPQDLLGKRIGVPSASLAIWDTFLKANSIDPSTITVVPVQLDPTTLVKGTVDRYLGFVTDEPIALLLKGFPTYQLKFADFGYSLYGDCYITTAAALANPAKRALVVGFLRAERLGWRLAAAEPLAAAAVSGPALGLDPHQQGLESQAQAALVQPPGSGPADILTLKEPDVTANLRTLTLSGSSLSNDQLFDTSLTADLATV